MKQFLAGLFAVVGLSATASALPLGEVLNAEGSTLMQVENQGKYFEFHYCTETSGHCESFKLKPDELMTQIISYVRGAPVDELLSRKQLGQVNRRVAWQSFLPAVPIAALMVFTGNKIMKAKTPAMIALLGAGFGSIALTKVLFGRYLLQTKGYQHKAELIEAFDDMIRGIRQQVPPGTKKEILVPNALVESVRGNITNLTYLPSED